MRDGEDLRAWEASCSAEPGVTDIKTQLVPPQPYAQFISCRVPAKVGVLPMTIVPDMSWSIPCIGGRHGAVRDR